MRRIDEAIGDLPLADRVVALVATIVTRRPQALKALVSLISLIVVLARELSLRNG